MGVSRSVRWNLILRLDSSYLVHSGCGRDGGGHGDGLAGGEVAAGRNAGPHEGLGGGCQGSSDRPGGSESDGPAERRDGPTDDLSDGVGEHSHGGRLAAN